VKTAAGVAFWSLAREAHLRPAAAPWTGTFALLVTTVCARDFTFAAPDAQLE
jgi:hypothetical protein